MSTGPRTPDPAPLIIGHRGFPTVHPDNSLAGVQAALAAGADGVEVDVRPCLDGTWVCHHDRTRDDRPVRTWSRAALRRAHPVVYAEWLKAGPSAQTVLFYGHYNVQPTDPIELWRTNPFEPVVVGDNLFARGASDLKGQVMAHLSAIEAILRTGDLPVNLKIMLEGEEEIGSPSLPAFIEQHKQRLKSDFCLNGDSGILGAETPALTISLRGLAYFEIVDQKNAIGALLPKGTLKSL